jgi:hypothetical protein
MKKEVDLIAVIKVLKGYDAIDHRVVDQWEDGLLEITDQHVLAHNYHDLVLDLLGVPPESDDTESGSGFCRDELSNAWYDYVRDMASLDEFLSKVKATTAP